MQSAEAPRMVILFRFRPSSHRVYAPSEPKLDLEPPGHHASGCERWWCVMATCDAPARAPAPLPPPFFFRAAKASRHELVNGDATDP